MKVLVLDDRMQQIVIPTKRVLVVADDGVTPLVVASQYMHQAVCVAHFNDPEFQRVLDNLGLAHRVAVERAPFRSLAEFRLPGG